MSGVVIVRKRKDFSERLFSTRHLNATTQLFRSLCLSITVLSQVVVCSSGNSGKLRSVGTAKDPPLYSVAKATRVLIGGSFGARNHDALANVRGQGSRVSCLCIQSNGGQKRARGNLLRFLIDHFVREEKDFLAHPWKPGTNGDPRLVEEMRNLLRAAAETQLRSANRQAHRLAVGFCRFRKIHLIGSSLRRSVNQR